MSNQLFRIIVAIILFGSLNVSVFAQKIEKERSNFKKLLIKNPNYFGTLPDFPLKAVQAIKYNSKYEELSCLGFYPEEDLLEAIVDVKLPLGYQGDLCSNGSYEYVRFFADWNGDADFNDAGEDLGLSAVNVHDIPNARQTCLRSNKPMSYALPLRLDSVQLKFCKTANLVKVRAILSWEVPPTAGDPDYPPVWGNVVEKWIQIRPYQLSVANIYSDAKLKDFQVDTSMINLQLPVAKSETIPVEQLKAVYHNSGVPKLRYNFSEINQKAQAIKLNPSLMAKYKGDSKYDELVNNFSAILAGKQDTSYEELKCVGLDYDQNQLAATLTIKRELGYSGNLCQPGSYEYVAFWLYVYDQIEQQCVWRYVGTSNVNVHDIVRPTSQENLEYAVYLPVDFSSYSDKCSKPKVMKVRAILSWNSPPPTSNPYYQPYWGNVVDANIQIKPGNETKPGEQKPFIWSLGNMAVENISGNSFTILPSAIGDGYANGVSVGGGFTALESPFGRRIKISGTITNAPDISSGDTHLKYKVQYRKAGASGWHDITNTFAIQRRINGMPVGSMSQSATGGYYLYRKDLQGPDIIEVLDDVLAQWITPVPEGDGLYHIRLLFYQAGAPYQPGIPADHVGSESIKIMIDNTAPNAAISLDAGPCTEFSIGDLISGKFTATDQHIWYYSLTIEPSVANPPVITTPATVEFYPALAAPGKIDDVFKVTTTSPTTPCGYVIHLRVRDRTIRNNYLTGNGNSDTVGLCLLVQQ